MAKSISILYVSSEIFPFQRIGGIGDVSYSLPLAIRDLGHDMRIMLPKYGAVSERKNRIHDINRLRDMQIEVAGTHKSATVKSSSVNNPRMKVQAYVVTCKEYFDDIRSIFSTPEYEFLEVLKNDERFIFYSRCAVETCITLGWFPDIMHCNGWRSALIPAFAKLLYPSKFKKTKFVLSVQDFSKAGEFPEDTFDKCNLPEEMRSVLTHDGKFSFLETGLHYADSVVTMSPEYAESTLENDKLDATLREVLKSKKLFTGISCGVDDYHWNPRKDALVKHQLKETVEQFKAGNKAELLHQYLLEPIENAPLIGIYIEPLMHCDLKMIFAAVSEIAKYDVQILMLLKEGDNIMQADVTTLRRKFYDNFAFSNVINDVNVHQLLAGCDMILYFPSENINCQQVVNASAYGAVPIVRQDGCMKSITNDYSPENSESNAFIINGNTIEDIKKAVGKATEVFSDTMKWGNLVNHVIEQKFSWGDAAKKYEVLYYSTLKEQ